ncbi:ACP S-malonyltransferase [Paenibacillus polymyxa]|uniref:ACP S-malonyltransferase n=1 Tax=Paenibacillus polymyxa TaxID=1406 RepID=UPI00201D77F4|nr:ACP S-malonyltransferase [Paenibacillus polymyxa]
MNGFQMNKVSFIFPGQGSQYVGMSKELWDNFNVVKRLFEEADDTLGVKLSKLCFEGDSQELLQTMNAQPALLTASLAAYYASREILELEPQLLAGHSLGEYSALVCSGFFSFQDGLQIVRKRGMLMQQATANGVGTMAAVANVSASILESLCQEISTDRDVISIACHNSDNQYVLSGHTEPMARIVEQIKRLEHSKVNYLTVSGPFHSTLMKPAADKLAVELKKFPLRKGRWPVVSNVTALPHDEFSIYDLLYKQMISPVRWTDTMDFLYQNGITVVLELGPRKVLGQLMKERYPTISTFSVNTSSSLKEVDKWLSKQQTTRKVTLERLEEGFAAALIAQNRNRDYKQHMEGVVYPSQQIRNRINQLQSHKNDTVYNAVNTEVLELIRTILTTKQVPDQEQQTILNMF